MKLYKVEISKTFANRGTSLSRLQINEVGMKTIQQLWSAHINNLGGLAEELHLPKDILTVITIVNDYITSLAPSESERV